MRYQNVNTGRVVFIVDRKETAVLVKYVSSKRLSWIPIRNFKRAFVIQEEDVTKR
jgi:hypothetical protein